MDWTNQLGSAAVLLALGLGWRSLKADMRDMEKRIRSEAERAHAEIGNNIALMRREVRDDINGLRGDVKELNTRVSRVEGKLDLPGA